MVMKLLERSYGVFGAPMGKGGGGSAPAAPDPAATAAAQTATNKETALWNAVLNNVNQITPYGSLKYTQTGGGKQYNMDAYNKALDAYAQSGASGFTPLTYDQWKTQTGNNVNNRQTEIAYQNYLKSGQGIGQGSATAPKLEDFFTGETPPQFTSTVELTPESQQLLDTQLRSQNALASLGESQIGRIQDAVTNPYSYSGLEAPEVAQGQFEDAVYSRLNPQFDRDEESLRTRLANQGIMQGSEAWNNAFNTFNQAKNDARMQAVLGGQDYALNRRNQAISEYDAQRNAPLNEYIGLTSGTQVRNPQFTSVGYGGAQPVDYANLINQNYQSQLGQYNAGVASRNNSQNALLGLAGTIGGSFLGNPALGLFGL